MHSFLLLTIALLLGYYVSAYFSAPVLKKGKEHSNRLPTLRIGNLEILPNFRLHIKNTTIWFHHWFYLSVVIIGAVVLYDNLMHYTTLKAAASASVGGIIQGLTYPDRFKFKHPRLKK